jgi:hypothetical protein
MLSFAPQRCGPPAFFCHSLAMFSLSSKDALTGFSEFHNIAIFVYYFTVLIAAASKFEVHRLLRSPRSAFSVRRSITSYYDRLGKRCALPDSQTDCLRLAYRMARKTRTKAHSTNILDYHSNLSMYEKDSLACEAKLKAERDKERPPKSGLGVVKPVAHTVRKNPFLP